ncbi:hypothetical protein A2U01_0100406, partial [Trifolium medium]|nr:hypothetical protein [Trifolium medium]
TEIEIEQRGDGTNERFMVPFGECNGRQWHRLKSTVRDNGGDLHYDLKTEKCSVVEE